METVDVVILVCFIPAVFQGLSKGFIQQVTGLVSLLVGVILASRFSGAVSEWLQQTANVSGGIFNVLCFIIIAAVTIVILSMVGRLLTRIVRTASLGLLNSVLGLLFSLLKAFIVIGLLIILFDNVNSSLHIVNADTLNASTLYCTMKKTCLDIFPYLKNLFIQNV